MKTKKLVIVGNSYFAEIAYEYFENDSDFKVVAFSVEESYRTGDSFNQLPLVPFEELGKLFDPKKHFECHLRNSVRPLLVCLAWRSHTRLCKKFVD